MGSQLMQTTEINCETNEVIERDMTADEVAGYEAQLAALAENEAREEADRLARENAAAAKATAQAKLAALGLTPEEIAALGA
jgi:hypothetical protein